MINLKLGHRVKFTPTMKNWQKSYTLDGVSPGDVGVVTEEPEDGDVRVDFTRKDGTVCTGFYAFIEDVEIFGEVTIASPQEAIYYLMLVEAGIDLSKPENSTLSFEDLFNELRYDPDFDLDVDLDDVEGEFRSGQIETPDICCDHSRHYESSAVAAGPLPDGRWVGWTYWSGGGKYGAPWEVEWIPDAYFLTLVSEEQKVITVRTFEKESNK